MTTRATAPEDGRLDVIVATVMPDLSRSRAAKLIKDGRVTVDGEVVRRASHGVDAGATLVVEVPPPVPDDRLVPQDLPLRIVYQDADLVVVDKDPGMVVHPGAGHPDGTLVNALMHHVGDLSGIGGVQRPGIVHRLDRGTSGLLVVAKHDRAHEALAAQFADHSARRTYLAITFGAPKEDEGTIRSFLGRHPRDRVKFASVEERHGRHAVTHWRVLARGRGLGLVRCRLETGRTHQIRVHLTEAGYPLAGDPLYRHRRRRLPGWLPPLLPDDRVMLHAWRLRLHHPGRDASMVWEAPPPPDFQALLDAAGLTLPDDAGR